MPTAIVTAVVFIGLIFSSIFVLVSSLQHIYGQNLITEKPKSIIDELSNPQEDTNESVGDIQKVSITEGSSNPSNPEFYSPNILSIPVGTTVSWSNDDWTLHTATSGNPSMIYDDGPLFDSGILAAGKTFEHKFSQTGTYDYYCTLHPYMTGKIVVTENEIPDTSISTSESLSTSKTQSIPNIPEFKEYISNPIGIKLKIPSKWTTHIEDNSTEACFEGIGNCSLMMLDREKFSFFDGSTYGFSFSIIKNIKENGSLANFMTEQYWILKQDSLENNEKFSFIGDRETTINNYPAWEMEYSFTNENKLYKSLTIVSKVNDTIYSISYTPKDALDYSKYLPEFQTVLHSLEFIPSIPPEEPSFLKQSSVKIVPFTEVVVWAFNNMTSEGLDKVIELLHITSKEKNEIINNWTTKQKADYLIDKSLAGIPKGKGHILSEALMKYKQ